MPGKEWTERRKKNWSPGDLDYPVRLKYQKEASGAWVFLTRGHIHLALAAKHPVDPDTLLAVRTVLDPGTGQILIRLKKAK